MRIPSGTTDQYIYFYAVDATDFTTPETGLSSFTVYRSRNGGASAAYTTPTINETDSTNQPGVYELLLDEDTTLAAGNDSEEYVLHISHTGMAPVVRTIEIYRPKITLGDTLATTSGVLDEVAVLTGHTAQTGDSFVRLGAPAGASVSADIATVDTNVDAILVDTGTTLPGTLSTMDGKLDTIDTNVDAILVDTGTTLPGTLSTIDTNVDAILVDTGTTLPGTLSTIEGKIDTVDTNVDAILVDTGTTLPGTLTTMDGKLDTIDTNVDAILVDTGTTLPGTLSTIDTNVDAILVDTGTTLPGQISGLNDISVSDIFTGTLAEAYSTDGSEPTLAQALYLILQFLTERDVAGTTCTVKRLDGSTTAYTLTLNDATSPTNITRSS